MTKHSLAYPPPPTAQLSSLIHSSLSTRERTRRALCARQQQRAQPLASADYSSSDARLPGNKGKNRYSDVLPYNKTRVRVEGNEGEEGYVNASWIEEVDKKRRWIAAQAPLPSTIPTFYSLLLPSASTPDTSASTPNIIIQLTSLIERGILKAHPYLPTRSSPLLFFPPSFSIRFVKEEHHEAEGCVVTDLELTWEVEGQGGEQKKRIRHLFFGSWPDKGVPTGRDATGTLVRFIKFAEAQNRSFDPSPSPSSSTATPSSLGPPMIVHCSAGVGRTGSFISIASLLRLLPLHSPTSPMPSPSSTLSKSLSQSLLHSLKTPSSSIKSITAIPTFPRPEVGPLGELEEEVRDEPCAIVIDWCREQRCMMVETIEQVDLVVRVACGDWR